MDDSLPDNVIREHLNKRLTFHAVFQSARTTVDGGWRITLDLSADASPMMAELLEWKDRALYVAIIPDDSDG